MAKTDYQEDKYYRWKPEDVDDFNMLSDQIQKDLIEWYNVSEPDDEDKKLLLELYLDGRFRAWNCAGCGDRVYDGQPDSWDNFQGTLNRDFCYFGDPDKYQEEYLQALCNNCRMHSV